MTTAANLGTVTHRVAANLRALRQEQGLSTYKLARHLGEYGWPLAAGAITRIETGKRHVTVDDLAALAAVLGCEPGQLLLGVYEVTQEGRWRQR